VLELLELLVAAGWWWPVAAGWRPASGGWWRLQEGDFHKHRDFNVRGL
jgi:hypothetical protein